MAGQHIEREARYEQTGLTALERDRLIWTLRRRGWSQQKILEGCASGEAECWSEHPDPRYEGYMIPSFGRARSPDGQLLKPNDNGKGYLRVQMPDRKRRLQHLVLEAYVGPRPPGMHGLHWNDVPADNMLPNLRWGSSAKSAETKARST